MVCLRDETADLHRAAETRPFQKQMVKGEVSRDQFVRYLGQIYHVHRVLEDLLDRSRYEGAIIEQVWRDDRRHVSNLVADLSFYGADIEGTRRLIGFLTEDCCQGRPELCGDLLRAEGC